MKKYLPSLIIREMQIKSTMTLLPTPVRRGKGTWRVGLGEKDRKKREREKKRGRGLRERREGEKEGETKREGEKRRRKGERVRAMEVGDNAKKGPLYVHSCEV